MRLIALTYFKRTNNFANEFCDFAVYTQQLNNCSQILTVILSQVVVQEYGTSPKQNGKPVVQMKQKGGGGGAMCWDKWVVDLFCNEYLASWKPLNTKGYCGKERG